MTVKPEDGMFCQIADETYATYELVFIKNHEYEDHFYLPSAWQPVGSVLVYDPIW